MIEKFRSKKFNAHKQALLKTIQGIIQEYQQQNIKLTLRQLYYQLVARDIVSNVKKEYDKLIILLRDARYNGLIDWDAIEDRIRVPSMPSEWDDVLSLVESAKASYRLPRWNNQDYYLELYTEKDALSSILEPIARKFHIHFCVNRGYTSASAIYDLSKRIISKIEDGKKVKIFYLGDHDPSGLDMIRDIRDRLRELLEEGDYICEDFDDSVEIIPIALTMAQVKKYNPPPNFAKITDPRAKNYIAKHGNNSWEVDALKPDVMIKLVENSVMKYMDYEKFNKIIKQEKRDMMKLENFARDLRG